VTAESVATDCKMPVATLRTCASITVAPDRSATVPRIVAVVACPHAADGVIALIVATTKLGTNASLSLLTFGNVPSSFPGGSRVLVYARFAARNLALI
jgi:hypothetical protein